MNPTLYELWQGLIPLLLGIIGYFLIDLHSQFKKDKDSQQKDIAAIRKDITDIREFLPYNFITYPHHAKEISRVEYKVDRIHDLLMERRAT